MFPIYRWGIQGSERLGTDRIQTQVCLTPKTTNFAGISHATPQAWIRFWSSHRADSRILIPRTQPRQEQWQQPFYFPLPCQDHLTDISLTPEEANLPKCLWLGDNCLYPKYFCIIRYWEWLSMMRLVLLCGKMIKSSCLPQNSTPSTIRNIWSLSLQQTSTMGTVHGGSLQNSQVVLGLSSVRYGTEFISS